MASNGVLRGSDIIAALKKAGVSHVAAPRHPPATGFYGHYNDKGLPIRLCKKTSVSVRRACAHRSALCF
jgi:hypothetical protein